jgi:hypothetical protein
MALLDDQSHDPAGIDLEKGRWLAQTVFGLFLAGLMVSLVVLYWNAPLDF